jgi:hypothetical protein
VKGKIFVMISSKGKFVAKLPQKRVDELVNAGKGERFDPGQGRIMMEWIVISEGSRSWVRLAREAYDFVRR